MNWRHKQALEVFTARRLPVVRFASCPGIGKAMFKTAIEKGWIVATGAPQGVTKWWQKDYEVTEAAREALRNA